MSPSPTNLDDASLARQAAAGSADAFAQLVRRHQATVRWFVFRLVRDTATADDLAQEVFLRTHQHLAAGRTLDPVRPWLFGVARNLTREYLRSHARRLHREQGPLAVQLAEWRLEQSAHKTEQELDAAQQFAALRSCLDTLAPESRRVVEEHYFDAQSLETIAARQNRTGGALRMMLLRIRQSLRTCLEEKLRASP